MLIDYPSLGSRSNHLVLGEQPYKYEFIKLSPGASIARLGLHRYCVYMLALSGEVSVNGAAGLAESYFLGDAEELLVHMHSGYADILLASQPTTESQEALRLILLKDAKKVEKPWGHEIWLTGDPSRVFAFKRILLKAGKVTSLQYHAYKRETNFILSGVAHLHYCSHRNLKPEMVTPDMIRNVSLEGPVVVNVYPNQVHRLEALTDLDLFEVSTPELDDVYRIHDQSGRGHGRIDTEHSRQ